MIEETRRACGGEGNYPFFEIPAALCMSHIVILLIGWLGGKTRGVLIDFFFGDHSTATTFWGHFR